MHKHDMHTYKRLPLTFTRGQGVWLWDQEDNKYLDALAGIAVCTLGHAHDAVTQAICEQAGLLLHTTNLFQIEHQDRLADKLCALAQMDRAFFCNSGAEANEAAIKLARLYARQRQIQNPSIIVMEGAFHGRTLATLTASGSRKIQAGFEPLVQGFNRVPYNDIEAVRQVAENNADVVAIMLEPIQGESGVVVPDDGYLKALREICNEQGWLLILDEIQTGLCRTGQWFAWMHEAAQPDIITLAKSLGNGVPIGACLARGQAAELFQPGSHGTTFGGNPLVCRVALVVLETLENNGLAQQAANHGDYLKQQLQQLLAGYDFVKEIRGKGLMVGIELDRPAPSLVQDALKLGVVLNVTAETVIRLLPPLIISKSEIDQLCQAIQQLLKDFA
ncbi:MAG: aspartate aminotransferase family protein [Gammaproteobacteria bacterium]|nr:MAG: aspartate aminotransferase family protein [Gammaproteobacteria bacterium]